MKWKDFSESPCVAALMTVCATASYASPTMIRLGYSDCSTCHLSPRGGGLLTAYGKGIDEAQSLRRLEVRPTDTDAARLLYDVRFVSVGQLLAPVTASHTVASSLFRIQARSAVKTSEHSRLNFAAVVESPTFGASTLPATAASAIVYKALYEYHPTRTFELAVGRDEMPSGIGLPDPLTFIRKGNDAGDTAYSTQLKASWYRHRLQLTPYVFGPGGDEPVALQQHGAGVVAGVDVWKQRAVIGMPRTGDSARVASDRPEHLTGQSGNNHNQSGHDDGDAVRIELAEDLGEEARGLAWPMRDVEVRGAVRLGDGVSAAEQVC